jgi:redox-sensitive bicupin YhaK (pirin superfamily)
MAMAAATDALSDAMGPGMEIRPRALQAALTALRRPFPSDPTTMPTDVADETPSTVAVRKLWAALPSSPKMNAPAARSSSTARGKLATR